MVHVRLEGGHVPELSMMKYLVDVEGLSTLSECPKMGF